VIASIFKPSKINGVKMYKKIKKIKLDDRIIIEIIGTDTKDFLQPLITNNIDLVSSKKSIYAALLSPQGKYIFDFFIFENSISGHLSIDCAKNRCAELLEKLNIYKLRYKINFNINNNISIFSIYGTDYSELELNLKEVSLEGSTEKINNNIILVDPRNKKLGLRIYSDLSSPIEGFNKIPDGEKSDLDYIRIELSVPNPDLDLEIEKSFLIENNFEFINAIDFKKGCYVGQENTARQKYRGTAKKKLFLIRIIGDDIINGTKIYYNERVVGTMRSSCKDIGLATIRTDFYEEYKNTNIKIKVLNSELKLL
jgi:folate-binding protein YgfZ